MLERDGPNCVHCGRETRALPGVQGCDQQPDQMTIEHYPVPRCQLPVSEWLNPEHARIACLSCNTSRS